MRWTIGRKLGLAFGFSVLAMGLIGWAVYREAAAVSEAAARLRDGSRIRDGADALALEIRRLEARPFDVKSAQEKLDGLVSTLADAARNDPAQAARVASLQSFLKKHVRALLRGPGGAGNAQADEIGKALAELRRHEANLLIRLEGRLASATDTFTGLILGTAAAALGMMLLGIAITTTMRRSLRDMVDGAREAGVQGYFRVQARTSDELADLGDAINSLAEKLRQAQEREQFGSRCLEAALEMTGDGVIVTRAGGEIVMSNAAAAGILSGGSRSIPSGWPTQFGFYSPDTRTPFLGDLPHAAALRGDTPHDLELYVTPPGSAAGKWLQMRARPLLEDGKRPSAVVTVLRDTTEHKRAESALRENEEKFRSFVETTNEWIWSIDSSGRITYSNPAAQAMLGYDPEELIGRPIESLLNEEDRNRFRYRLRQCVAQKRCWAAVVLRWNQRNGSSRYTESNAVPILGPEGEVAGMRGADRDITERRATEMHIEQLNNQLERRVAQLNAANKELEAFSYSVSHDLRAPLRSIDGFSQALLEDYGDRLDATGRDYLQRVRAASQRMAQLIDDMLQLSRVARNELSLQTVDVTALAEAVGTEQAARHPDRAVDLVVAPGMTAQADPHLLRIVMENLLDNAWKFTRNNPNARVEVGIADYQGDRAFFVKDNGVGFDMAYAGKLFGAFQRLHAMTEFEGTGVGLATVQRIVNRHGGSVAAQAEVGRGATIYFTLS
jgi:PAS domain S-box-containing protein